MGTAVWGLTPGARLAWRAVALIGRSGRSL